MFVVALVLTAVFGYYSVNRVMAKTGQTETEEVVQAETTEKPVIVPVSQPVVPVKAISNEPVKSFIDIQLLSANIDWSQVSACLSNASGVCVCYGASAQRLVVPKESCELAVQYGWARANKKT